MGTYQLKINLTKDDLALIKATNQKVVLVKENDDSNHIMAQYALEGMVQDVAWVTFAPLMSNTVSWEETYDVYASTSEVVGGATIDKSSTNSATAGIRKYQFNESGYFDEVNYNGDIKQAYYIENLYSRNSFMTFGLAQSAVVNGTSKELNPINATPVAYQNSAYFIPMVKVKIFLAASADDGKVISVTQSKTLTVDFTEKTTRTVKYDQSAGAFVAVD